MYLGGVCLDALLGAVDRGVARRLGAHVARRSLRLRKIDLWLSMITGARIEGWRATSRPFSKLGQTKGPTNRPTNIRACGFIGKFHFQ